MLWSESRRGVFLVLALLAALRISPSGLSAQQLPQPIFIGDTRDTGSDKPHLTVTVSVSQVTFSLITGGAAVGAPTIPITTTWNLTAGASNLQLQAYLDSATISLTNGVQTIPSSMVFGSVNGGPFIAFTQAGTCVGCSLILFNQMVHPGNLTGTRNDNLTLKIDLTGSTPSTIGAGNYIGTVHIQAIAT